MVRTHKIINAIIIPTAVSTGSHNDDSSKTIELIAAVMAKAIQDGAEVAKARRAEGSADVERIHKEGEEEEEAKVQRRMRERKKPGAPGAGGRGPRPARDNRDRRENSPAPSSENTAAEAK